MFGRRDLIKLAGALTVGAGLGVTRTARAAEVIKIGTLYPKSSPWGQVFSVLEDAVKQKTGGKLELQFFHNAQQGDEAAIVGKMKAGQLDAAALSTVGLSKLYKPIGSLSMPGLFANWSKLDAARDALKGEFEKGVKDAGFIVAGWTDVGVVRQYSKGFAIKVPDDLKAKKPWLWRDDTLVQPALYQVIGGISPVPLNVPEVLPNLNTGAINAILAPSLFGEQLQWTSKLDTVLDHELVYAVGAVVLSSKRVDSLPPDLRQVFTDMGRIAAAALTARIRSEDAAAYMRSKSKMTVNTPSADEKAKWAGIFKQLRQRLAQGTFAPELVTRLEKLGGLV